MTGGLHGLRLPRPWRRRPDAALRRAMPGRRTLRLYLVKPSKYDDGLVMSFRWGVLPNNTLIVLAGLSAAYQERRPEIDVQVVLWDELLDGVLDAPTIASICARARADGALLLTALAGVQSNQFPRARDIALELRRHGAAVAIGGFHVSSHPPSRALLQAAGVTCAVGEAETIWPELLDDHLAGRLAPLYEAHDGVRAGAGSGEGRAATLARAPLPRISRRYLASFLNPSFSTIDTARGCPFRCSFCSVKTVVGRTVRSRDPGAVIDWLRDAHDRLGVRNVLLVDDDFYRSPRWQEVLVGLAELRRQGRGLGLVMQVDVAAASSGAGDEGDDRPGRTSDFVELAAAAGCFEVFVGLESFDPANLARVGKLHNAPRADRRRSGEGQGGTEADAAAAARLRERYRCAVERWHHAGVAVHAGFIIGMPLDGVGCGRRAARDLRAIGVDLASFFVATPFPGTEDYDRHLAAGRILEHDFGRYDSTHAVWRHPRLTPEQLEREYHEAFAAFYDRRRLVWCIATGHRVPGLSRAARAAMLTHHLYYAYALRRGWHPMLGGVWRRARRTEGA